MGDRTHYFFIIIVFIFSSVMATTQQPQGLNPPLSNPNIDVSGRVFVITGGTQGLGLEIASILKEKGAKGNQVRMCLIHVVRSLFVIYLSCCRASTCVSICR